MIDEELMQEILTGTFDRPSHWDEHPDYPAADWQYEVANGDTRQGYDEWLRARVEAKAGNEGGLPYKITIVFGEQSTRRHCNGVTDIRTLEEYGSVEDFGFATRTELNAFIRGASAAEGWMDWCFYDPEIEA